MGIVDRFAGRLKERKTEFVEARQEKRVAMKDIRQAERGAFLSSLKKERLRAAKIKAREVAHKPPIVKRIGKKTLSILKEQHQKNAEKRKELFEVKNVFE